MKRLSKRLLAMILLLATVFANIPIEQVQAAASSGTFSHEQLGVYYQFDSSFPAPFGNTTHQRQFRTYYINQGNTGKLKQTYCIQYGVEISTGSTYSRSDTYSSLSSSQKALLNKVLIFGYNDSSGTKYGGTWIEETIATQAMIWIVVSGYYDTTWESKIVNVLLANSTKARNIYNTMRDQVEEFNTIPSFTRSSSSAAAAHELKYNMTNGKYELTLTDSNKVLDQFDFSASGISFSRSGNKLTISTTKELNNVTVTANKKLSLSEYPTLVSGSPEYWTHGSWQHLTALNVEGDIPTVSAVLKLQTEKIGNIKLTKKSEDGVVSGLKFRITGNGIDKTVTTGSNGEILIENLVAGDYTITEISMPDRYVQPKTQVVTVKAGQTSGVTFSNVLKKFNIHIVKSDVETGSTAQGQATLDGAEYDIYDAAGKMVDSIKAEGRTATSKLLVLGTYTIYERVAPAGYTLSENPITVTGDAAGQTVEIGRADAGITDRVIKGQVAITKFADKPLTGDTEDGGMKQPLKGIEFTFTLKSTGEKVCAVTTDEDGYTITPLLPYGIYTVTESIGAEGYRKIAPFDVAVDTNGKIYKYILENTVYESDVKIVKVDADSGKEIQLSGTQFKIKDATGNWVKQSYNYPKPATIDTFETTEDGTLVLPQPLQAGKYELHEVKAPHGYTISTDPIPFEVSSENESTMIEVVCSNKAVKGKVSIEKLGEQLVGSEAVDTENGTLYQPIYEVQNLEGVIFDLVAAEDIITGDGTVQYEKGTVVDTMITGSEGATSKEVFLGKYLLIEKSTVSGFVLDSTPHPVELTYADQNTAVVTIAKRIENDRQRAKVSLYKAFETVAGQSYSPYEEITFGLFARADIRTVSGEVAIEQDSLIEIFGIDESGNGEIVTDLSAGSYYVRELTTGTGYLLLDEAEYDFEFQYMGTTAASIPIHMNDGKPINNELMRGAIEITKTSEDHLIEGVSFKVTGETKIGTSYEQIFQTDEEGKIHIDDLLVGTYTISEVVDDVTIGYITPEDQTVTVEDGKTAQAAFKNILIRGGFSLLKTDEDGNTLQGVTFGLFNAADNEMIAEFVTDEAGTYSMSGLVYGDYYIKELATLEGYYLDEDIHHAFSIREHEQTFEFKVVNKKIPEETQQQITKTTNAPKTGDATNIKRLFALLVISAAGIAVSVYIYRRKKKTSD